MCGAFKTGNKGHILEARQIYKQTNQDIQERDNFQFCSHPVLSLKVRVICSDAGILETVQKSELAQEHTLTSRIGHKYHRTQIVNYLVSMAFDFWLDSVMGRRRIGEVCTFTSGPDTIGSGPDV